MNSPSVQANKYAQLHKLQEFFETLATKVLQFQPEHPLKMIAELAEKEHAATSHPHASFTSKVPSKCEADSNVSDPLENDASEQGCTDTVEFPSMSSSNNAAVMLEVVAASVRFPDTASELEQGNLLAIKSAKGRMASVAAVRGSISQISSAPVSEDLQSEGEATSSLPFVVFVVGASMSGKTTLCEQLVEQMKGVAIVHTNEIRQTTALEASIKGTRRTNLTKCFRTAVEERAIARVVMFDGAPESLEDVLILEDHEFRPHAVVSLEVPAEVLSTRRDERIHRTASANTLAGDNPASHLCDGAFQQRAVAEYYRVRGVPCTSIDASQPSSEVVEAVQRCVNTLLEDTTNEAY